MTQLNCTIDENVCRDLGNLLYFIILKQITELGI